MSFFGHKHGIDDDSVADGSDGEVLRPGGMHRIADVHFTTQVPDETLAQAVAATARWHRDDRGVIYDDCGVYLADSLTECAEAMRRLGWFTQINGGSAGHFSGVIWSAIDTQVDETYEKPEGHIGSRPEQWAELVRAAVLGLRHQVRG